MFDIANAFKAVEVAVQTTEPAVPEKKPVAPTPQRASKITIYTIINYANDPEHSEAEVKRVFSKCANIIQSASMAEITELMKVLTPELAEDLSGYLVSEQLTQAGAIDSELDIEVGIEEGERLEASFEFEPDPDDEPASVEEPEQDTGTTGSDDDEVLQDDDELPPDDDEVLQDDDELPPDDDELPPDDDVVLQDDDELPPDDDVVLQDDDELPPDDDDILPDDDDILPDDDDWQADDAKPVSEGGNIGTEASEGVTDADPVADIAAEFLFNTTLSDGTSPEPAAEPVEAQNDMPSSESEAPQFDDEDDIDWGDEPEPDWDDEPEDEDDVPEQTVPPTQPTVVVPEPSVASVQIVESAETATQSSVDESFDDDEFLPVDELTPDDDDILFDDDEALPDDDDEPLPDDEEPLPDDDEPLPDDEEPLSDDEEPLESVTEEPISNDEPAESVIEELTSGIIPTSDASNSAESDWDSNADWGTDDTEPKSDESDWTDAAAAWGSDEPDWVTPTVVSEEPVVDFGTAAGIIANDVAQTSSTPAPELVDSSSAMDSSREGQSATGELYEEGWSLSTYLTKNKKNMAAKHIDVVRRYYSDKVIRQGEAQGLFYIRNNYLRK